MTQAGQTVSHPTLPLQQAMLYHLLADPRCGVEVSQIVGVVREPLDFASFSHAWQRLMDRHAVLRSCFRWTPGQDPVQEFPSACRALLVRQDWRGMAPDELDQRMEAFLEEDLHQEVVLERSPLWRVTVMETAAAEFRFVVTGLHAMVDGHSLYLVVDEVFTTYDALRAGGEPTQTEVPQFPCFLQWMRQRDGRADEAYWREQLHGFAGSRIASLPASASARQGQLEERLVLPTALIEGMARLARAQRGTLNLVTKAAWAVVLGRWSGAADVVFGEVHAGRRNTVERAHETLGLFMNTLPVRTTLTSVGTVAELLDHLREQQRSVRGHEHAALQRIQEWSGLPHGAPLFESLLVFGQVEFSHLFQRRGGAWANRQIGIRDHTSLPLTLHVHVEPQFTLRLLADRSRFDAAGLRRMLEQLHTVLESLVHDPSQRVAGLEVLPVAERQRLVTDWNQTEARIPAEDTLASLWERQVRATPEREALIWGDTRRTYRQLDQIAGRWTACLHQAGVKPDSLVGICLDRAEDLVVALLAAVKAGAAYVPLDPAYPEERLRWMVEDAQPVVVLTSQRRAGQFQGSAARVICLDAPPWAGGEEDAHPPAPAPVTQDHLAYVIHTSGSTGRPKGVMITQRNVVNFLLAMDEVLGAPASGRWLAVTSICFDISVLEVFYTLTRGLSVVLAGDVDADPEVSPARLLQRHEITHFQCTPSLARLLIQEGGGLEALRAVKVWLVGGEPLPPDLLRALGDAPGRTLINVYGPTETTVWSTAAVVHAAHPRIPIGRPVANTRLYVVDAENRLCPTGVPGELWIGGEGVARGYLNRPDLTAERFLADPFRTDPGARVYRTGDLVRYGEDGALECLGRLDQQIKLHGHRIELGEIEAALVQAPNVKRAVVHLHQPASGEGRLVAYLIPGNPPPVPRELRAHLSATLPAWMVPRDFVLLEDFPLTPNGKLDRKALPGPPPAPVEVALSYTAPRNPTEALLAEVWQEILKVPRVGVHDDFFELGGDSVALVRVSLVLRQRWGREVPLNTLFSHATIEALAAALPRPAIASGGGWAAVETYRANNPGPPLFAVHGVENIFGQLRRHLAPGRPLVIITATAGFDGRVPPYHPCRSVEDMAGQYLQEVRRIQPHGPYDLMGFCLGGLIAYEIARRLREEGEAVGFLGAINSLPVVREAQPGNGPRLWRRLHEMAHATNSSEQVPAVLRAGGRFLRNLPDRVRVALARSLYPTYVRWGGTVPPDFILRQIGVHGWNMVARYVPQPYPGKVWLFGGSHAPSDSLERWRGLALGGVGTHQFEAGHYGLMEEPHVRALAAAMNACLMGRQSPSPAPQAVSPPPAEEPVEAAQVRLSPTSSLPRQA